MQALDLEQPRRRHGIGGERDGKFARLPPRGDDDTRFAGRLRPFGQTAVKAAAPPELQPMTALPQGLSVRASFG